MDGWMDGRNSGNDGSVRCWTSVSSKWMSGGFYTIICDDAQAPSEAKNVCMCR